MSFGKYFRLVDSITSSP